jgi:hypothetical protein
MGAFVELSWLPLAAILTILVASTGLRCGRYRDIPIALLVGAAATLSLFAVLHDVLPSHPPVALSWLTLGVFWTLASTALGIPVAEAARTRLGVRRASAVLTGIGSATAFAAFGPGRLLTGGRSAVEQLAWTLGEEDSAQIVGIAREIITSGPAGGELAEIYGTGFMVVPLTLMRMLGLPGGESDPRILAIYAFTFSVTLAVATLGLSMALLALSVGRASTRPSILSLIATVSAGAIGGVVALSLAVFLPMQTGFLTLVWSMAWVALTASFVAIRLERASALTQSIVLLHVSASIYLVVRSWPFLLAATLPPLAIALRPLPWRPIFARLRSRWYVAVGMLAAIALGAWQALSSSLFGEVLSYGREALTISASGIFADRLAVAGVSLAIAIASVAVIRSGAERWARLTIIVGVPGSLLLSWFGLKLLALLLTDGELNYAGWKLFYATVSVSAVVGLAALAGSTVLDRRWSSGLAGTAVGLLLLTSSSTVQTYERWWDRTSPQSPPHAVAAVDAVKASSVNLPIRCMPKPGTAATDGARWAAYYCVRWMEDAFNVERFHGHRFTFLNAEGPTFEDAVDRALRDDPNRYAFAYPMTLGRGWFGWDGTAD